MNDAAKETLVMLAGFAAICAVIGGIVGLIISTSNTDDWTPVDDKCYVRYYENNRLFGEDSHSRDVYCKRGWQ